ncbi:MAG TPA: DUF1302 family protein [Myxococcaceae bacterium]|nr:DUF1302 family protein [Myxococcaceae bacterium]
MSLTGALLAALLLGQQPDPGLTVEDFPASPEAPAAQAPRVERFEARAPEPRARVFGSVRGLLGVDTRFEPPPPDASPENVVDGRARANLGVDVKLSDAVRVLVEGRAWWRSVARQGFERAKATVEPFLGEAFVDIYGQAVDLRVGNQILTLGANPAFAPADALNPRDLRQSLLQGEPEDARLPVFALRAQGELSGFGWSAAYVPFFAPDRYAVYGQDESLLQPGWEGGVPLEVDASIEDALQPLLLETKRPRAFPWLGDVAVRVTRELGKTRLGASWVWMTEKLPQVRIDPELRSLMDASARGAALDPAVLLSVQQRLGAREQLYAGTYARGHLFSVEASRVVGPAQLDLDVTWTPARTFYTDRFEPVRKPALTWVLGVTQAEDSPWLYNLSYVGMAIAGVGADELLAVLEPSTARGAARTAWFHLISGSVSRRLLDDRLELGLRAAFEPIQRSFALGPRVTYRWDRVTFLLAAEFLQGTPYSPFGYFGRNDQVLGGVQVDLF